MWGRFGRAILTAGFGASYIDYDVDGVPVNPTS